MSNIQVLRQRKADLHRQADAILHAAEEAGRQLTADANSKLDDIKIKLQKANVDVAACEAEMDAHRNDPAVLSYNPDGTVTRLGGHSGPDDAQSGRIGATYRELFPEALSTNGFASREEFFRVLHSGLHDSRLFASNMNESTPAEGGFLVPTEYSAGLLDASLENEIVRPRATVFPMTTSTRKIAGWDGLDHSAGSIAGFTAAWLAEGAPGTIQAGKTKLMQLTARKLALFTQCSNELVADGMTFEEQLGQKMTQAVGWGLDLAFLTGNGAGKPLGVINAPSTITVDKDSGDSGATITTPDVLNMFARLHPGCMSTACWVCNNTTIPKLLALTLGSGTAVTRLLEQGPDGRFSMLTRPVLFSEKVPALGTPGDIMLVDFTQYAIGLRREVSVEKSQHVGWQTDESGYRTILRVDGQPIWEKPFTPKNGSTLSWAVILATRS